MPQIKSFQIDVPNLEKAGIANKTTLANVITEEWVSQTPPNDLQWFDIVWSPELEIFAAVAVDGTTNGVMTSPDGINWTTQTPAADLVWTAITWAASVPGSPTTGLFVAVAQSGVGNRVMTSPDGITWTSQSSAGDMSWNDVTWSPELNIFVSVAVSGISNRVMTSPDGITWTLRASADDNIGWTAVEWSPELGLFAAVSTSTSTSAVMTSPDGITWTSRTTPANTQFRGISWSPELGKFVAVASYSLSGPRTMISSDGITWELNAAANDTNNWMSVTWATELGIFAAVANTGTSDQVMISSDGINWTSKANAVDNSWRSVAWSPKLGIFAAVAQFGTGNGIMTSFSSRSLIRQRDIPKNNLTATVAPTGTDNLTSGYSVGSRWINVTTDTEYVCVDAGTGSPLVAIWIETTGGGGATILNELTDVTITPATGSPLAIAEREVLSYDSTSSVWTNLPAAGAGLATTESLGNILTKEWVFRESPNSSAWKSVVWAAELGIFVAIASSTIGSPIQNVMTSPDGINWTLQQTPSDQLWQALTWSPELTLFVAVSSFTASSPLQGVMTSPDGVTWTLRETPASLFWNDVTWSAEVGLFVAVAQAAIGSPFSNIMTSPDGINWTLRDGVGPSSNRWAAVVWAKELNLFVSTSYLGGTTKVMTSPDGINWTIGTTPTVSFGQWYSLVWSPELGIFVALDGAAGETMISSDGFTWTAYNITTGIGAASNNWRGIAWSAELGLFVACADSGDWSAALATSPDGINWTHRPSTDNAIGCQDVVWSPKLSMFVALGTPILTSFSALDLAKASKAVTTLDSLTDVVITPTVSSPLEPIDGQVLSYDSGTNSWINQSLSYYIDVTTGVGSPLGMTDTILPTGWTTTYNSVGNFTITHNLGSSEPGFALSVLYNTGVRIINPISITTTAITFQIQDAATPTAVEGNVVGKLLF